MRELFLPYFGVGSLSRIICLGMGEDNVNDPPGSGILNANERGAFCRITIKAKAFVPAKQIECNFARIGTLAIGAE